VSNLIEVNDSNFEAEVLRSPVPVLVDFFGEHCGPCRMLKPVLVALAESMGNSLKIVAVDVAANERLVNDYRISALPTLIVFREGKERDRMVGLKDMKYLMEALAV
jgi:thioredoxin 1